MPQNNPEFFCSLLSVSEHTEAAKMLLRRGYLHSLSTAAQVSLCCGQSIQAVEFCGQYVQEMMSKYKWQAAHLTIKIDPQFEVSKVYKSGVKYIEIYLIQKHVRKYFEKLKHFGEVYMVVGILRCNSNVMFPPKSFSNLDVV